MVNTARASGPAELADRVRSVRERIAAAAQRSGRDPGAVTLVAVTKTRPIETIRAALASGLRELGENRVQELVAKSDAVPGAAMGGEVRWHVIGSLQRNKAAEVAARADLFHALDSDRLALELDKQARKAGRVLPCLVQVNISGEDSKHGVAWSDLDRAVGTWSAHEHLDVVGLMGMAAPAAPDEREAVVRPVFARLREAKERLELPLLSIGMSGDFEIGVEEGATHVRVGSALFGPRG